MHGGDAFGVACMDASKLRRSELEGLIDGAPDEQVRDLRDYSSKVWRKDGAPPHFQQDASAPVGIAARESALKKASEDKELAMLTGRSSKRPKVPEVVVEKRCATSKSSSSSSESSSGKKKKHSKQKCKKKQGKEKVKKSADKSSRKSKKDKKGKKSKKAKKKHD